MKVLKVSLHKGLVNGRNQIIYPKGYNAEEIEAYGVGPGAFGNAYSPDFELGQTDGFCLIALRDDIADRYAQRADMQIISFDAADKLMAEWYDARVAAGLMQDERITDPSRILLVLAKAMLENNALVKGETPTLTMSQTDMDALDPQKHVPGVERGRPDFRGRFGRLFEAK